MRRAAQIGLAAGATAAIVGTQEWMARRYYARTRGPQTFVEQEEQTAWTAVWHELLAPAAVARLAASPVYQGHDVPRGNGEPVVLVHGFLMRGYYLRPMERWFRRLGYDARTAAIGLNADCVDVMTERLLKVVASRREQAGVPVHLIAHSLGGLLARAVATRAPDAVASVSVLDSPFRGLRIHPVLRGLAAAARAVIHARRGDAVRSRCLTLACDCASVSALRQPVPADIPQLAVVGRYDGLVDRRYCMDTASTTVEVPASHMGLVWSPEVYRTLAHHVHSASAVRGRGAHKAV